MQKTGGFTQYRRVGNPAPAPTKASKTRGTLPPLCAPCTLSSPACLLRFLASIFGWGCWGKGRPTSGCESRSRRDRHRRRGGSIGPPPRETTISSDAAGPGGISRGSEKQHKEDRARTRGHDRLRGGVEPLSLARSGELLHQSALGDALSVLPAVRHERQNLKRVREAARVCVCVFLIGSFVFMVDVVRVISVVFVYRRDFAAQ